MEEIDFEVCPYGDSGNGTAAAARCSAGYSEWTGSVQRSKLGGIPNWGHNRAIKTNRLVCLSVCHTSESCKNGCTNQDTIRVEDSGGSKEPCIRWGPDPTSETQGLYITWGSYWRHLVNTIEWWCAVAMRPYVKLLWQLAYHCILLSCL